MAPPQAIAITAPIIPPEPPMSVYEEDYIPCEHTNDYEAENQAMLRAIKGELPIPPLPKTASAPPATKTPPPPPPPKAPQGALLPKHGSEDLEATIKKVAHAVFNHLVVECGAEGTHFTNPEAIYKPIEVGQNKYIHSFKTQDHNGVPTILKYDGTLLGHLTSVIKLPIYDVVFKDDDGKFIHRLFLPQNPSTKSGAAARARKGSIIMWVCEPDIKSKDIEAVKAMGNRATKMAAFIENYIWFKTA
jgi:hypothetical protein